nr:MAG TPA: hypothetical protein [Caudoviricetes sp.]
MCINEVLFHTPPSEVDGRVVDFSIRLLMLVQ